MTTTLDALVSQLTLEEKAALCTGDGPWTTVPVDRLDVPRLVVSDGPHGVRRLADLDEMVSRSLPATCFPSGSCLSASWNPALVREVGEALGAECVALGVDVILGPSNNVKRTPLCGRNFEYFSEDPYLSGELAVSYIQGVQSRGVGTALKHFTANNQEFQRFAISAEIDERTLHEIYLPAFEQAVTRGRPWTVMCAYNKVNGTYCSEHRELLAGILRERWGFEGLVMSDWGAVHDRVAALRAGLDLEMPGPKERRVQAVVDAVRAGELHEEIVDEAARRILRVVFAAQETPKGGAFDRDAHHALARRVAAEGIVLLKNDGVLPLENVGALALIGRAAKEPRFQGGGSSHVQPTRVDVPYDEIEKLAGGADLRYAEGYPEGVEAREDLIDEAVRTARASETAVVFVALPATLESEGYDRPHLDLTPHQVALIRAVTAVQPRTVVVVSSGSAIATQAWSDDAAAVLQTWLMGQAGGGAVADVLFGRVDPSGRLAETFPRSLTDTPAFLHYPGELGRVRYGEGIYVGYRYYDAKKLPVAYPFGHGLSYTTFAYSDLRVPASPFDVAGGLEVSVDVTNTGRRSGKDVVQLYVRDVDAGLARPPKELKGFAKVSLEPGRTQTVTFELGVRAFAYYHPGHGRWITEDGDVELLVGASAGDIRLRTTVTLRGSPPLPSLLHRESTVRAWLDDPRGRAVAEPRFAAWASGMSVALGAGEDGSAGMDMLAFIRDTPLLSVLHFMERHVEISPEDEVDRLLREVHERDA